jgi:DNA repair protein RecO (recombination protein O)
MELIVNAIVLKAVDYKDNDKILTLFSLEKGKITAGIKGVKKSGAKLKSASEPFAFCEYVLVQKNGRYTVTNATYIDSFFNLRLDLLKYYSSAVITDSLNALITEGEPDSNLFSLAINVIKSINYQNEELKALCFYLLNLAEVLGYQIQGLNCQGCGEEITGRVFFSPTFAEFYCFNCKDEKAIEITYETYSSLQKIINQNLDIVLKREIPKSSVIKLLKFLFYYLQTKTDSNLKTATSLVDFLKNY